MNTPARPLRLLIPLYIGGAVLVACSGAPVTASTVVTGADKVACTAQTVVKIACDDMGAPATGSTCADAIADLGFACKDLPALESVVLSTPPPATVTAIGVRVATNYRRLAQLAIASRAGK
jgi:hypothetical protein